MNDGSENKQLKISRACKNDLKDFPNHNLFVLRFEKNLTGIDVLRIVEARR
jgi:hypothetical protein